MWWAGGDFTKSQAFLCFCDESRDKKGKTRIPSERKEGETESNFIDFMRAGI